MKECENFRKISEKLTETELKKAEIECDKIFETLRKDMMNAIKSRIVIAHIDMDAFYAQVEILDNPAYETVPMAVGGMSMLTTSNYEARKYGVRAAMPGFIAKRLCTDLIIIPPNFKKYEKASGVIHGILSTFDAEMVSTGLDEAYINISKYFTKKDSWIEDINELVMKIKKLIFDSTHLTCSIGVSCSGLLAKISSNINKPNGHFILLQESTHDSIISDFIFKTPVGRINGVGHVTEKHLEAIGVKTCEDIYKLRARIKSVFGIRKSLWLFNSSVGLDQQEQHTKIKSNTIGIERTFYPTTNRSDLLERCVKLASCTETLLEDGKLLTDKISLKIKFDDFQSITRCHSLNEPTACFEIIKNIAVDLLKKEIPLNSQRKIRLLGLRLTKISRSIDDKLNDSFTKCNTLDDYYPLKIQSTQDDDKYVKCPICSTEIYSDDTTVNRHIDECLNLNFIKNS
ncbi:hypothetical protein MXB_4614 [Myxobolus squamalis]|nr:hypothetical protein MXB_4614 [Myxobolus squamalis]